MAGLVPGHPRLTYRTKNVDARDKPGHDELFGEDPLHCATPSTVAAMRSRIVIPAKRSASPYNHRRQWLQVVSAILPH